MKMFTWTLSIPIHTFYEIYTFEICQRISLHFWCAKHKTMIRACSMSADALVSDAARAPMDIMLPMHVHLQIRSFNWCRFLSYSCTVFMWTHVRKFNLPCVTSVTWTNLSLYLIITWRIKKPVNMTILLFQWIPGVQSTWVKLLN